MALPIILSFGGWKSPAFRFGLIWTLGTLLPIFTATTYVETRYMVIGAGGLALLIAVGLDQWVLRRVGAGVRPALGIGVLFLLAFSGTFFFGRLFPVSIDERDLGGLIEVMEEIKSGELALAAGWVTDFCYLRMLHPEIQTFITWCGPRSVWTETEDVPEAVIRFFNYRWIGPERRSFFQDTDTLYVGWQYNPSVMRLMEILEMIGLDEFAESLPSRLGLNDHRTLGWPWLRGWLDGDPAFSSGDYSAYRFLPDIRISGDSQ